MDWTMKEMRKFAKKKNLKIALWGKRKIELFNAIVTAYSSKNSKKNKKESKNINQNKNKVKVNDSDKLKIKVGSLNHKYSETLHFWWDTSTVRELIIENAETKSIDESGKWEFKPKTTKDAKIMEEYGFSLIKKKKINYLQYTHSKDTAPYAPAGKLACIFSIIAQKKEKKRSNKMTTTLQAQCAIVFSAGKVHIFCTFSLLYICINCIDSDYTAAGCSLGFHFLRFDFVFFCIKWVVMTKQLHFFFAHTFKKQPFFFHF